MAKGAYQAGPGGWRGALRRRGTAMGGRTPWRRPESPTTEQPSAAGVGAVVADPVGDVVARAGGFVDTAEAWGYEHPQTVRAYQRLRGAWRAAEVRSPEDADDDVTATVRPLLRVVDRGDERRGDREGRA